MNNIMLGAAGVLLPLAGTTAGAAMALLLRRKPDSRLHRFMLGGASGVMLAASVWSLLIPAIEMTEERGGAAWFPAVTGFLLGVCSLLAVDVFLPVSGAGAGNGTQRGGRPVNMLALAVTLHNIPEGMAVGVVFAGALTAQAHIAIAEAFALSLGIALQNIPEGMIISMPMVSGGAKRGRAFRSGFLSGVVEPVGAVLTLLLTSLVVPVLPYILAFAAGAMVYVVTGELIPEAQEGGHSGSCTLGTAVGFALMMLLDVAL